MTRNGIKTQMLFLCANVSFSCFFRSRDDTCPGNILRWSIFFLFFFFHPNRLLRAEVIFYLNYIFYENLSLHLYYVARNASYKELIDRYIYK